MNEFDAGLFLVFRGPLLKNCSPCDLRENEHSRIEAPVITMSKLRFAKLVSRDSFHTTSGPWRTGQTRKAEEDLHALLPNNPFVPPKGDICFIKNLPPELLSRIFEVGSAENDSEGGGAEETDAIRSSAGPAPWLSFQIVVSHVCRHWRNVAISAPFLWTRIDVTLEERPPYESVSTRLERSKGLPIDIYVNCDVKLPSDADLGFLFPLLILHVHRWRTVKVSVWEYRHMAEFLNAVSDPSIPAASQLTSLGLYYIERDEYDSFGVSKHPTLFGDSTPLLARLVLWGVHVDWNQPWITSASNLTGLELVFHAEDVRPSWAQFASILRGASALEKLSLRKSGPSGDPHEWFIKPTPGSPADLNAPVRLPHLTDLTLAFHSQARAIGLLHKFCLPALKHLVLEFYNGNYTEFVHELAKPATSLSLPSAQEQPCSLLRNLKTLKIAGLPCLTECVETLYSELENLTSLSLSLWYLSDMFLVLTRPHNTWLPRLVTLYVSGTCSDAICEVVRKRKEAGVPLNSLYVEASCDMEDGVVEWLRENLETFGFFEESDDQDMIDFDDEDDEWVGYELM